MLVIHQPLGQAADPHDAITSNFRSGIERCFDKLEHFCRIATRYDRRAIYFLAAMHLARSRVWMRRMSSQP
jgi:transposase